jgi:peroxiredoxin
MSGTVTAASAARTVLAARTSPDAAVLVVALRGGHWPYSCGLASTVRHLAPRLLAAGAEVVLLAGGTRQERETVAAAWRLPFRWLSDTAGEPVARELGVWDEASGRILDGLGLLGPDGDWILRQDFDDLGGTGSPDAVMVALRQVGLRPVPVSEPAGPVIRPLGDVAAPGPGAYLPSRTGGGAASAPVPATGGPAGSPPAGSPFAAGGMAQSSADRVAPGADSLAPVPHRAAVRDPAQVAGILRRALAAADRLTQSLPPSSPAAAKAARTRFRLALYLRAVHDLVPAHSPT